MKNLTIDAQNYLTDRGVLRAAVEMGLTSTTYYGTPGLAIPVRDKGGARVRFRAFAEMTNGGKTRWMGKKSYTPKYYFNEDKLLDAIAANNGQLTIATGEFDMLTFGEIEQWNVIAFSSENSIPADLVEQARAAGVQHINYWHDNDKAGAQAARELHDLLEDSGITFTAYTLDGLVGEKGDTNDLWQAVGFDRDRFLEALRSCPLATLPPSRRKPKKPRQAIFIHDEFPPDFVRDVVRVLERQPQFKQRRDEITCCSPLRNDKNASFSFNTDKLVWKDFGTGEGGGIVELGRELGIEINDYRDRPIMFNRPMTIDPAPDLDAVPDLDAAEKFQRRAAVRAKQLNALYPAADDTFERQYVGNHPAGDVITDSGLGTGKTHAAAADAQAIRTVEVVNDRTILTETLADKFEADHYETFTGEFADYITAVDRLSITVDSLHRRAPAQPPQMLYVDEPDYVLRQLSAQTMKDANRDKNARALRGRIAKAARVIAGQANVSPVGVNILKALRPGIRLVKNTYTPDRGKVSFSTDAALVALDAHVTAASGGIAALTSDSRKLIQKIAHNARNEDYDVFVVHGHNSQDPAVRQAVKQVEAVVQQDRGGRGLLVLLSPSAAVGFDVSSVEFDYSGTVGSNVVTPETYVQMNMRIRHAKRRRVSIPGMDNNALPTEEDDILEELRIAVMTTADLAEFSAYGVTTATDMQGWITRIDAAYTAWDNMQRKDMVGFTAAYFQRAGFKPVLETDIDEKEIKNARQWLKGLGEVWEEHEETTTRTETAITAAEFDDLRTQGLLREHHYFGRLRDKIENAAGGRDINVHEDIYERFRTTEQRRRMYRAELLNLPRINLQALDRADVVRLPKYRRHHTAEYDVQMTLWSALFGYEVGSTSEIYEACQGRTFTEDDLDRLRVAAVEYGFERACKLIGYTCSFDPLTEDDRDRRRVGAGLLHALMRSIKLSATLNRSQPTVNGKRINVNSYTVDDEVIEQAQEDLDYREKWRAAMEREYGAHEFISRESVSTQSVCSGASYSVPATPDDDEILFTTSPLAGMTRKQIQAIEF